VLGTSQKWQAAFQLSWKSDGLSLPISSDRSPRNLNIPCIFLRSFLSPDFSGLYVDKAISLVREQGLEEKSQGRWKLSEI
jgi:hypothetical protein